MSLPVEVTYLCPNCHILSEVRVESRRSEYFDKLEKQFKTLLAAAETGVDVRDQILKLQEKLQTHAPLYVLKCPACAKETSFQNTKEQGAL